MAQESLTHRLTLIERQKLTMTGVTEVVSFDESAVVLQTCMGSLTIQGTGLQLKNLTLEGGQVEVDGTVTALEYEEAGQGGGWLRRFFA